MAGSVKRYDWRCHNLTQASTSDTCSYRRVELSSRSRISVSDPFDPFGIECLFLPIDASQSSRRGMRWYANRVRDFGILIVSRAISRIEVTEITVHRSVHRYSYTHNCFLDRDILESPCVTEFQSYEVSSVIIPLFVISKISIRCLYVPTFV